MLRSPLLDRVVATPPAHDAARAARALDDLQAAAVDSGDSAVEALVAGLLADGTGRPLLQGVCGNSPFLTRILLRDVGFLPALFGAEPEAVLDDLLDRLDTDLASAEANDAAMQALRVTRRRVALLVALADVGGLWPLAPVTDALSRFADAAIGGGVRYLMRQAAERGEFEPADPLRAELGSGLAVIGMGKLGARELNYSSDVDLIVFFDQETTPYVGGKTAQEAFIRVVRELVRLLQEQTADGYVLRTDLRLRPDPGATPVAISMQAAEQYYESLGQNWERAAMIKARAIAGDLAAGSAFLDRLTPFIWRRYLDFASIEDVHSIKRQIHSHRGHSEIAIAGHNIKVGRGGIRDIEFFVQTQQLIAGGRDPALRDSTTCGAMQALAAAGWLQPGVVDDLTGAYRYLRTLEHRLQMIADEQTQTMPKTPDGIDHVARFMGESGTGAFEQRLTAELQLVQRHYGNLFEAAPAVSEEGGNLVFTGADDDPETLETLSRLGFAEAQGVSTTVRGWHHGRYRCTRTQRSREILTKLMPSLLKAIAETANPNATLGRFDRFLAGLPSGIQLFSMLSAQPHLLALLAEVMGSAPRLADYLGRNPGVLDAVLSEDFFDPLPPRTELQAGLEQGLRLAADYQDVLDEARRWVKDRRFQLGVQCLRGAGDADIQGHDQAVVAETAIATLYPFVLEEFAQRERHGHMPGAGMAIVGMGKLGSQEMTATSDLDLVLIYDFAKDDGQSDGARPLMGSHYFTRLSQRLINAITAPTAEGKMYEVDMRLRPSGAAGPVATRLAGFVEYHDKESWTWEHMALTRARLISGPPALQAKVREAIDAVLRRPRDVAATARDVTEMRARIDREKGSRDPWELKLVRGGLLDVEFTCQYLQLVNGAALPSALHPNTCTALDNLASAGVLDGDVAEELTAAFRLYLGISGLLRIAVDGDFDPAAAPQGLRDALVRIGGADDFAALERKILDCQARVLAHYERLVEAAAG